MDAHADYGRAGFGRRLGFGNAEALLVVDVCKAYVEPTSPLYAGVEAAAASVGRLVTAARKAAVPVYWTRVVFDPGAALVFHRKVPSLALFATELGEFLPGIEPAPGEVVISKNHASAFFGTSLAQDLRSAGIDTVVLCGFSTSGCVRASTLDALQHDFVPIVVAEACGDRHERPHEQSLFDLDQKYADVLPEAQILGRWA